MYKRNLTAANFRKALALIRDDPRDVSGRAFGAEVARDDPALVEAHLPGQRVDARRNQLQQLGVTAIALVPFFLGTERHQFLPLLVEERHLGHRKTGACRAAVRLSWGVRGAYRLDTRGLAGPTAADLNVEIIPADFGRETGIIAIRALRVRARGAESQRPMNEETTWLRRTARSSGWCTTKGSASLQPATEVNTSFTSPRVRPPLMTCAKGSR